MGKVFDKSVFASYFSSDDADVLAWSENVLQKLKEKGLVADYIQREADGIGATDFEDYYRPITIFFGYLVKLAREFETFYDNEFLLNEYLIQHGQFTCGDETLDQLVYALQNSLRIRAQRGGLKMIEVSQDVDVPDGELLRLICWDENTFFKLGVAKAQFNGWNMGHSSPCFKGNTNRYDLNVGYENTEDVIDLDAYPLVNEEGVFLTTYRGKECLEIEQVPAVGYCGIGGDTINKRIVVDPRLNFEITFYVAQDITEQNITFGCLAFDINGDPVDLQNVIDGSVSNKFFETRRLNQAGKFYFVRGILFNMNKEDISEDEARLNIGFGHHLRMPENVVTIVPQILFDGDASDDSDDINDESLGVIAHFIDGDYLLNPDVWVDDGSPTFFTKSADSFSVDQNRTSAHTYSAYQLLSILGETILKFDLDYSVTKGDLSILLSLYDDLNNLIAQENIVGLSSGEFGKENIELHIGDGILASKLYLEVSADPSNEFVENNFLLIPTSWSNDGTSPFFTKSATTFSFNDTRSTAHDFEAFQNFTPSILSEGGTKIRLTLTYDVIDGDNVDITVELLNLVSSVVDTFSITGLDAGASGTQVITFEIPDGFTVGYLKLIASVPSILFNNYDFEISLSDPMIGENNDFEVSFSNQKILVYSSDSDSIQQSSAYDLQPSIFLWNVKVTPASLPYERCYLNNKNFTDIILANKNGKYSSEEIRVFLRKYFIPYSGEFGITNVGELGEVPVDSRIFSEEFHPIFG